MSAGQSRCQESHSVEGTAGEKHSSRLEIISPAYTKRMSDWDLVPAESSQYELAAWSTGHELRDGWAPGDLPSPSAV